MEHKFVKSTYKVIVSDEREFGLNNYVSVYTQDNKYIGTISDLEHFFELGIYNIQAYNNNQVCSIGFNDQEQKWYGWSHRAMCGFGIGHVVKEGNCEATTGWTEEYIKEHPEENLGMPVGFECKTLDDCKKCAMAFADSVS